MKSALILNFTGNVYHFGCYGTSHEIYYRLLEKNYIVNYLSVMSTHGLECWPKTEEQFFDPEFVIQFGRANPSIIVALHEADIVVVNGEGTLHRLHKGPKTLLYIIFLASKIMEKKVYLINHSCFPSGDVSHNKVGAIYAEALSSLQCIVVREPLSALFYQRQGLLSRQGFDSLPLFIDRYNMLDLRSKGINQKEIVLGGGVAFRHTMIPIISQLLASLGSGYSFIFLIGGKGTLAPEDNDIWSRFKQEGLPVFLRKAKTFEEWCNSIAKAGFIVSARFHYTVAAMSMGVPCLSFPSNTPKIEGIYQMFGIDGAIGWDDENFREKFILFLKNAKNNELILTDRQRVEMLRKAENNFIDF